MSMATLIRERRVVRDSGQLLDSQSCRQVGEVGLVPDFPDAADLVVPRKLWALRRDDLLERRGRLGLRLEADDEVAEVASDLEHFALVAVDFPKFGDGRGYSTARLLRERYGYKGELRAVGEVLRDQLQFLEMCGFDAYALRDDQDAEEALRAFADFSEAYQASVTQPV